MKIMYDAVILGGGFYGCQIALALKNEHGFKKILVIEKEKALLLRASFVNQTRVHNGYHYPRSYTTAYRSRINYSKFIEDFSEVIEESFIHFYGVARYNSKITSGQFIRFCRDIGAYCIPEKPMYEKFFSQRLIDSLFRVDEYSFNPILLRDALSKTLVENGIDIMLETKAILVNADQGNTQIFCKHADKKKQETVTTRFLFNCTYSGLNQLDGQFSAAKATLKHEIAEIALVKMPEVFSKIGITIMDGPFFSILPYPGTNLHTFTHVRYTPHGYWIEDLSLPHKVDPYVILEEFEKKTKFAYMMRDAARYFPLIKRAEYVRSLFEIKTILTKTEIGDGRPILFEKSHNLPRCYSILGSKIDNIYDALAVLAKKLQDEVRQY